MRTNSSNSIDTAVSIDTFCLYHSCLLSWSSGKEVHFTLFQPGFNEGILEFFLNFLVQSCFKYKVEEDKIGIQGLSSTSAVHFMKIKKTF